MKVADFLGMRIVGIAGMTIVAFFDIIYETSLHKLRGLSASRQLEYADLLTPFTPFGRRSIVENIAKRQRNLTLFVRQHLIRMFTVIGQWQGR